jgi:NADP-dependent 3-hydroxy acid dehydrogenase YdfG
MKMEQRMIGNVALINRVSSGIGEVTVRKMARAGARAIGRPPRGTDRRVGTEN